MAHVSLICLTLLAFASIASAEPSQNFLRNSGFETVEDGQASGWNCSTGGKSTWRPYALEPVSDCKEGKQAVSIPAPPEGDLSLLYQEVPAELLTPESTLRLELWGKAAALDQLQAVVSFHTPDGRCTTRAVHPGGGVWQHLSLAFDLPRRADLSRVTVEIMVRPIGGQPVLVDGARLWHEEIAPQYDLPESAHE